MCICSIIHNLPWATYNNKNSVLIGQVPLTLFYNITPFSLACVYHRDLVQPISWILTLLKGTHIHNSPKNGPKVPLTLKQCHLTSYAETCIIKNSVFLAVVCGWSDYSQLHCCQSISSKTSDSWPFTKGWASSLGLFFTSGTMSLYKTRHYDEITTTIAQRALVLNDYSYYPKKSWIREWNITKTFLRR